MVNDLPEDMKQKVREFLAIGDFVSAKMVHDDWKAVSATAK